VTNEPAAAAALWRYLEMAKAVGAAVGGKIEEVNRSQKRRAS